MAEIKSSIEIAMEKTRHLIMSEEEKREQKKRELEGRVRGLLRRLKERYIDKDDIRKEFESLKSNDEKRMFVEVALDTLNLAEGHEEVISVIEIVDEKMREKLDTELKGMERAFSEELEKREMILKERIREKLNDIGIWGDAISVNVNSWEEWEEAKREVQGIFEKRLKEWKESVISQLSL